MYKELFCKYKNRTVILNEFNVDCICAHCHQENCNSVKSLNIMNDCQERIITEWPRHTDAVCVHVCHAI